MAWSYLSEHTASRFPGQINFAMRWILETSFQLSVWRSTGAMVPHRKRALMVFPGKPGDATGAEIQMIAQTDVLTHPASSHRP